jgi:hypothetical protein
VVTADLMIAILHVYTSHKYMLVTLPMHVSNKVMEEKLANTFLVAELGSGVSRF